MITIVHPESEFNRNPVKQMYQWLKVVGVFVILSIAGMVFDQVGLVVSTSIVLFAVYYLFFTYETLSLVERQQRMCARDVRELMTIKRQDLAEFCLRNSESIIAKILSAKLQRSRLDLPTRSLPILATWQSVFTERCDRGSSAASMLPVAGLLGTVLGMIQALNAIGNGIGEQGDMAEVSKSLNQALAGMSVAFTTTLLASFLGGILLKRLVLIARSNATHLMTMVHAYLSFLDFDNEGPHNDGNL